MHASQTCTLVDARPSASFMLKQGERLDLCHRTSRHKLHAGSLACGEDPLPALPTDERQAAAAGPGHRLMYHDAVVLVSCRPVFTANGQEMSKEVWQLRQSTPVQGGVNLHTHTHTHKPVGFEHYWL